MRLTQVSRATGLTLARDVPASDASGIPLLRSGAVVTEAYQRSLADIGINAIWVDDALGSGIEPEELVTPAVRREAAARVQEGMARAATAVASGRGVPAAAIGDLQSVVKQLAAAVAGNPGAALVLSDLAGADDYTYQHSIDVCALGLLIGRHVMLRHGWRDFRGTRRSDGLESRLLKLGLGLLLHDVGKLAIPGEILAKPGDLTASETALVRSHPDAGAELLGNVQISPLVRSVIREHHERWDGSGYPRGLCGDQIHQLARIAAVADVYDAVTSERPYHPAQAAHVGVAVIREGSGVAFDPEVVDVFCELVSPYPVGSEVTLHDGSSAVVADVTPPDLVVRVASSDGFRELRIDPTDELLAA
jgi:HD-GYP domain-containing protein (c-di-GMP phosphodiesterase class II)